MSDIFGLQRVADQDGEIAFRSDDRFRTVSLGKDFGEGASVGIELWDEAALESAPQWEKVRQTAIRALDLLNQKPIRSER